MELNTYKVWMILEFHNLHLTHESYSYTVLLSSHWSYTLSMVCTNILPPYDAQSHPSQRMRVQHSQFLVSYLDLPAIIRKHVTFSTTQESGESSWKQTNKKLYYLISVPVSLINILCITVPKNREITNYKDFLALEMSPKSCVMYLQLSRLAIRNLKVSSPWT